MVDTARAVRPGADINVSTPLNEPPLASLALLLCVDSFFCSGAAKLVLGSFEGAELVLLAEVLVVFVAVLLLLMRFGAERAVKGGELGG